MLQFLHDLLVAKPKIKFKHPVLGELQLEQGARGPYWLREAHGDDELVVSVHTIGEALPTDAQAEFFQWVNNDLEAIYQSVAPELASRHQGMQGQPVQPRWHRTFRLAGVGIPLDGNRQFPWDLTFECLTGNSGHLYTCYFENGALVRVSVDT